MPERALIAAATNVLARGYHAVPIDRRSPSGAPVNALFAVTRALIRAIAFKVPARAVAVIERDVPAGWPEILKQQVPVLPLFQPVTLVVSTAEADEATSIGAGSLLGGPLAGAPRWRQAAH